jgi:ATP-dependent exoDNAse (exonuclease V) alpha subunit
MFVKNDSEGRYKNGTLATVTSLKTNEVEVELHDPPPSLEEPRFSIGPEAWERTKYALNEQTGKLEEASDGSFKQIPLTLAWAVTIHKSQGLTLEKVVADVAACFDSGQTYVALSRCTTLEGLVLPAMPTSRAITVAPEVRAFMAATTTSTMA